MYNIFLESIIFWIVVGAFLFIVGYAFSQGLEKWIFIPIGLGAMVLTIALGVVLVFFVDTDAKSIRRTIFGLEAAVIANDSNKAVEYLSKNSIIIRRLFIAYLKPNTIDQAKISNVKINEINKTTSPPRANVSFTGMAAGKGSDGYPFTVLENITVEMRQDQDGVWRVTDNVEFTSDDYIKLESLRF